MLVQANWWNFINSERDLKFVGSLIVNHLLKSWQTMLDFVEWHPPQERGCAISLQMELWRHQGCSGGKVNKFLTFNLIAWLDWV